MVYEMLLLMWFVTFSLKIKKFRLMLLRMQKIFIKVHTEIYSKYFINRSFSELANIKNLSIIL